MPEFIFMTRENMRTADTVTSRTVSSRGADASPDHTPRLHQDHALKQARHMTSQEVQRQLDQGIRLLDAAHMVICALAFAAAGAIGAMVISKGIANLAHFNVNFHANP